MKTSTPRDPMSVGGLDLAGQTDANHRRATLLVAAVSGIAGVVIAVILVVLIPWPVALGAGVVAGLAVAWATLARVGPRAMRLVGGVAADPIRHARLINVVEGLSLAAGVPPPELYVLDSAVPNAISLGLDPRHSRLIVTSGLLERLNRIELEGVVAHELSHIRAGDIRTATLGAAMLGPLMFLGPSTASVMRWLVGSQRESVADLRAVSLSRYPPGLAAALEAMAAAGPEAPQGAPDVLNPLWAAPPEADRAFALPPPLSSRIEALREL